MANKRIQKIIKQNDHLSGQTGSWLSYYQDCASFVLPRKAWITSIKISGEQLKYNFLYDVRAIRDVKKCIHGFHSNLSNPSSKWFSMTTANIKYRENRSVQDYFKRVEDEMYYKINNSNFDDAIQEHYLDEVVFGTGNIGTFDDPTNDVYYLEVPIEQYNFEEDGHGNVIAMYRNFPYTANQCFEMWGDKCSKEIKDAINDDKGFKMFDLIHYVGPRDRRDVSKKDYLNMEWESLWIVKKEEHLLEEKGFREFPYQVDRFWKDVNDPRGFSPVMDILASIKLVNAQKRTVIKTAMQIAGPAHLIPSKGFVLPFNLNPHSSNYYDPTKAKASDFVQIKSEGNIPLSVDMMKLEQEEIDQGLFIPLFETFPNIKKKLTIPEFQQIVADNMKLVGPAINRMTRGLRGVLFRTYAILERKGRFPEPPREIEGQNMEVIFLSPLARAQRASEMQGISTLMQTAQGMMEFAPDVMDNIDTDHVLDVVGDLNGADPSLYRQKKKIEEIRANRAKQQQAMQQAQLLEQHAGAAKDSAGAQKDMAMAGAAK